MNLWNLAAHRRLNITIISWLLMHQPTSNPTGVGPQGSLRVTLQRGTQHVPHAEAAGRTIEFSDDLQVAQEISVINLLIIGQSWP